MQATLHAPSWKKLGCRHSAPQQTNDRLCANQPGSAATHIHTPRRVYHGRVQRRHGAGTGQESGRINFELRIAAPWPNTLLCHKRLVDILDRGIRHVDLRTKIPEIKK